MAFECAQHAPALDVPHVHRAAARRGHRPPSVRRHRGYRHGARPGRGSGRRRLRVPPPSAHRAVSRIRSRFAAHPATPPRRSRHPNDPRMHCAARLTPDPRRAPCGRCRPTLPSGHRARTPPPPRSCRARPTCAHLVPDARSHNPSEPSSAPARTRSPLGEIASALKMARWPSNRPISTQSERPHTRIVPSPAPKTSRVPSGVNAMPRS